MITEEFSFPIITSNNVVHLTVLPPLWRISSINQSEEQENGRNNYKRKVVFRSFSQVQGEIIKKDNDMEKAEAEAEAEEKMDMLWEDFNIEEASNSVESSFSDCETDRTNNIDLRQEFEDQWINNVHELERPRTKKNNLELRVGKMMKKLFLLQNMARTKKRGPK